MQPLFGTWLGTGACQIRAMPDAIVHLHRDAPAKPATGQPCNGCGACCASEPCPIGAVVSLRRSGRCRALLWDEAAGRYRCGLLLQASATGRAAQALVARWIAAGRGCDADIELQAAAMATGQGT